jgi:hypothetical protein
MSTHYYDRTIATHLDGSPIFQNADDRRIEQEVANECAGAWDCTITSFGALSPVDWWAARDGRVIGVLELKARTHPITKYPTVFLSVRKWLSLQMASAGLLVPAILVVRFTDVGTRWVPLAEVDASKVRIGGGVRANKGRHDIEPLIDVPCSLLRELPGGAA